MINMRDACWVTSYLPLPLLQGMGPAWGRVCRAVCPLQLAACDRECRAVSSLAIMRPGSLLGSLRSSC
jgi:hypothetical protein